jgi:NADH-quinone oxidoreductase subunit F
MRDSAKQLLHHRHDHGHGTEPTLRSDLMLCTGTGCIAGGALQLKTALEQEIARAGLQHQIALVPTGCNGFCGQGPLIIVMPEGIFYGWLKPEDIACLIQEHFVKKQPVKRLMYTPPDAKEPIPFLKDIPFFKDQVLIVLRNKGMINPEKMEEYVARDGYTALEKVVTSMTPEEVVEEITRSGLRGRGGAGFPTGVKWAACRAQAKIPKYIVGNCDEGDPGAYMDRSLLESDPHSVVEGIAIAACAIGAEKGYVYIRTEYPLAIERLRRAIVQATEHGLLGQNILGTRYSVEVEIREGSGAFVCGEETSLIHSIEGRSPEPRQRPPFPVESGLWGCPTVINNVETLANVPMIISHSAEWYSSIGTATSKGTKIFSLVGKINNTGLIEVPMGITLRKVIYEIGGGIPERKKFKAVQTGGPSGGCIPAQLIDLPIDYESLNKVGSLMGSGGMVVMDEDTCMVDVSKFFLQFTNDESCGKCTSCRDGSDALLEVLTRITNGEGQDGDIEFLEELGSAIKDASMCGLGTTLPNPVLSTIRYFRDEYEAHIKYKKCPAVVCRGIISSPCQYLCPLHTDVPAYLTLTAKGKFAEALEVIRKTNPLPIICGRVCLAHCEISCKAREAGGPIAVRELKRFLTDWELNSGNLPEGSPFPRTYDEKVAIIGSGPAGLTAGYDLVRKGYQVTIFEKLPVPGGMLAVGIPEYRLPKKLMQMEIDRIRHAGVDIKTNSPVESIDALFRDGYKAVLVAIGAHKNRKLEIPGEDVEGVLDPITFLRKVNLGQDLQSLGDMIGIIGGGNTAIDTARTVLRLGKKEITIFYRRTRQEMPALEAEVEAALEEGIKIEFLVAPLRILSVNGKLKGVEFIRTKLGKPDSSGRNRPIPIDGSEFTVELHSLLPAVSQEAEIPTGFEVEISKTNSVVVNPDTLMTTRAGVFACGDAVILPTDVTTAMAQAQIVAELIHKYLRGEDLKREYRPVTPSVVVEPIEMEETMTLARPKSAKTTLDQRKNSFEEAELCYSQAAAMTEAGRCLRCDWETLKSKQKMIGVAKAIEEEKV